MYIYHKTYHKSSHICECENRSLLLKGCQRGQKSVLTELDWANPRQSSETAAASLLRGSWSSGRFVARGRTGFVGGRRWTLRWRSHRRCFARRESGSLRIHKESSSQIHVSRERLDFLPMNQNFQLLDLRYVCLERSRDRVNRHL